MGFGVWGLGFGVRGSGFGVWGLGFGVWGLGFGVWGLGGILRDSGSDWHGIPNQSIPAFLFVLGFGRL